MSHRHRVRIAEMPEYTLNVCYGLLTNGAVLKAWNGGNKGENDKWSIKDFANHSI
jgi:hypothetical protein